MGGSVSAQNAVNGQNNAIQEKAGPNAGLWITFTSFVMWGVLPLYWKMLQTVPSAEILLHRIIWSFVLLSVLIVARGKFKSSLSALKDKRTAVLVLSCGTILSCNWMTYIWSVNNGMVVEASLGYFLNPLVSMMFGFFIFKDRLDFLQWCAVGLAVLGVCCQIFMLGKMPWVALTLAFTFGGYGVLRKFMPLDSLSGLFLETTAMCPVALVWFLTLLFAGESHFLIAPETTLKLVGTGVVTAVPLLMFAYGVKRLTLTTVGLMQYIAPTCTLLIGVAVYKEELTGGHLVSFALIWSALVIYTLESLRVHRNAARIAKKQEPEAE